MLKEYPGLTPSTLDREDVARLIRDMNAGAFYRVAQKPQDQWTPDDIRTIWDTHMLDKRLKAQQESNE